MKDAKKCEYMYIKNVCGEGVQRAGGLFGLQRNANMCAYILYKCLCGIPLSYCVTELSTVGLFAVGNCAVGLFAVKTFRRKDWSSWDL